jgi:hypothetical protein
MNTQTQITNIITFHGITMFVVENDGIEYVYAKPLTDLAGIDWRNAKRALFVEEEAYLYGTKALNHPQMVAGGGELTTPKKTAPYIRLDRSVMFMARINTRVMKSRGRVEAAQKLLELQIEWADALYKYETAGMAFRKPREANLIQLMKARRGLTQRGQQAAVDHMINDQLAELGYPAEEPQQAFNL